MKLADLSAVNDLNKTLVLLTSAKDAAENGRLQLWSAIDGVNFDFGHVLDSVETRNTVTQLVAIRIENVKGKLRELGVDPDA